MLTGRQKVAAWLDAAAVAVLVCGLTLWLASGPTPWSTALCVVAFLLAAAAVVLQLRPGR